ncbi:MAG: hypothetical protein Q8N58_02655 [bacterium]|nr:hypothetical protein [bacterium]
MINQKIVLIVILIILLAGNIFLGFKYFSVQKELRQNQEIAKAQNINDKILDFTKLFIEKVLKAKTEIDFETRLQLENAVRNLNDEIILVQWQEFVESGTEEEAQENVKDLLEILVNKIKI